MSYRTINLTSRDVVICEALAGGAITPGFILEHSGANVIAQSAFNQRFGGGLRVALEDHLQGKTVDDAYASGDIVNFAVFQPGDDFVGQLAAGQNVAVGALLIANGAGALTALIAAFAITGVVASNNAIKWTAKSGNENVRVKLVDPSGNDKTLSVSVSGQTVTVSLATGAAGAITSTAAEVIAAIAADTSAAAIVSGANHSTSTGAAAVAAADVFLTGSTNAIVKASEAINNSAGSTPAQILVEVL